MQKIQRLYCQAFIVIGIGVLIMAGCVPSPIELPESVPSNTPEIPLPTATQVHSGPLPTPTLLTAVVVPEIPLLEQRELINEVGINQLISFDGIRPVYQSHFATAEEADMQPDDLVIGIAMDGQAKAYPVGVLRFREMVNDEIAGIPILVSW